jgi:copper chaperone
MIELKLPDMTCNHCVQTVTRTVRRVDAKAEVKVDLAEHRVQIESAQPREQFTSALAEEGYPAQ